VSTPPDPVLKRARQARGLLADRHTPFVFDAWYVAALSSEIGDSLLARTLLGAKVVMFRAPDGEPTALEDRCAHRSYPLSASRLDDGVVTCGYHGFRYDVTGACIAVPSAAQCPANIGVRRYPLVERAGLAWIWLGDAQKADPELIPLPAWCSDPTWDFIHERLDLPANYVSLHENLLDLTHIEFLHAETLGKGSKGYAAAPFETFIEDGAYAITRRVMPTTLPPIWARTTGLGTIPTAARVTTTRYLSPGCQEVAAVWFDSALPEGQRPEFTSSTAHLPTPLDHDSTHYFILHGWNFGLDDPDMPNIMRAGLFAAFQEDVEGLTLVQQTLEAFDGDPDFYEQSVGSDAVAVAMRRWLKTLADKEAAA
jgi:vanillate O-demethylase monooxygenase subunit